MTEYEALIVTLAAIIKHNPVKSKSYLKTLNAIVTLMNEVNSGRFEGAKYEQIFKHGQLTILIKYKGDRAR